MEISPESKPDPPAPPYLVPLPPSAPGAGPLVPPEPDGPCAISVRHAVMEYNDVMALLSAKGNKKPAVLQDFNMTVQRGHIYGLLGASGCGKTTLLRGIVGELRLTAGDIRVLGHEPRTPASGIPGTTVGYMPQELSLLDELTIMENLRFYGCLGGMTDEEIDTQAEHLSNLLELPPKTRLITTLSGGQKRRVSFAIALLHSPPVLVLDEPTVGVDPLLRESIWEYLIKIAKKNGTTVVITTHYIEEAGQADTVGLMRHGKLMAEDSPRVLIQLFNCVTLEEVLLKLCLRQHSNEESNSSIADVPDISELPEVNSSAVKQEAATFVSKRVTSTQRIKALTWKNSLSLFRHYVYFFLIVFLPTLIGINYSLSIGAPPTGFRVTVVNEEANCLSAGMLIDNKYIHRNDSEYCYNPGDFSCKILNLLENKQIETVVCENEDLAREEVIRGRAWAVITFQQNFTTSLLERANYSSPLDVVTAVIERGTIGITMDNSDTIMSASIQRDLLEAIRKILADFDDECHSIKHMKDIPMQFKPPIYGSNSATMRDFAVPGVITSVIFMFPLTSTLSALLPEIIQGTLERSLVSGVTMFEVIVSHFIIQLFPVALQLVAIFTVVFGFFEYYIASGLVTAVLISSFLAIDGMVLGFLLASICTRMTTASLIGVGLYFSFIFTSGTLWPVEGIPAFLVPICRVMPLTPSTEALRHSLQRGWTIANTSVQLALGASVAWCIIFLVALTALWMHRRR